MTRRFTELWILALWLCAAPALRAQGRADASLANAELAVGALRDGLADGITAEGSSAAGLKAEELLTGWRGGDSRSGAVDGRGGGFHALRQNLAASPIKGAQPAVPTPGAPPGEPEKPRGFFDGIRQAASFLLHPAAQALGSMGRAKRIALLVGLIGVEVAAILYPYQVVGVAMTALGVLGLFGTTRELISMLRRRE